MSVPDIFDALQDSYPAVTTTEIRSVERQLGLKLPEDYAAFLLKNNGGYFRHSVKFALKHAVTGYSDTVEVKKLTAITDDLEDVDDLRSGTHLSVYFDETKARNFVLIAGTWFKDQFGLAGSGTDFGKVYLWAGDDGKMFCVADSFTEFLQRLQLVKDETPELPNGDDDISTFASIRCGDFSAVESDLASGRDVNCRNAHGHTMLMCAVHYRWPKIVKLLLSRGADVHARDKAGEDAIFRAVFTQSLDCVTILLDAGANPNSKNDLGLSLVGQEHIMLRSRIYRTLVEHGANPDPSKEARRQ